ncbi:uncharacterized protein [Henckelia pumila]|uniref:uncharacterized protein n=1 Tax=Henckelia pumila TaxID=405737 RepID=UPI003C6DD6BA
MDPDQIARLVHEIKLSNPEDHKITIFYYDLKLGEERVAYCLAARVIAVKAINKEIIRAQIPRIMQFMGKVNIEFVGNNTFIFDFALKVDRIRALREGPWNFFQDLIVFKVLTGLEGPQSVNYDEISIWLQCHNIPVAFLNKPTLENTGAQIGMVEKLDGGVSGSFLGWYARMRIRINITEPLKIFIRVGTEKSEGDVILLITYERLPDLCYQFGVIGHTFWNCGVNESKMEFVAWMRESAADSKGRGRSPPPKPSSPNTNNTAIVVHEWGSEATRPTYK